MQRIHMGRIAGAVGAIALLAGLARRDVVSAMAAEVTGADGALREGQVRIDLDRTGVRAILDAASGALTIPVVTAACTYDAHLQQRSCRSHSRADSAVTAMSLAFRTRSGAPQLAFDARTTDSVTIRTAVVNEWTDRTHRDKSLSYRSTLRYSGVSRGSVARSLNGADTTFRSARWGAQSATHIEHVVTYSEVTSPNAGGDTYPLRGVLASTSAHTYGTVLAPRRVFENVLVYFDGTRTPETYINGQRFTLDLESGVATLKP